MKKLTIAAVIIITLLNAGRAFSQTCSCRNLLDTLIAKVETDYAGYIHKVKEAANTTAYYNTKKALQTKAETTSFADCYKVLNGYTGFFKDGHLFVAEFPAADSALSDSLHKLIKHFDVPAGYTDILNNEKHRDDIEGVWKDALNEQIAIVKVKENLFYGVLQQSTVEKWAAGMVKLEIEKTNEGSYNVTYYRNDFVKIHFMGLHMYKNVFLPFGNYRLAKILPHDPEIEYVNLVNPNLPVLKVIDSNNILLTVPSALIDGRYLDSLLNKYNAVIKTTPNLIIDLRGNTGGNYIWGRLLYIANTTEYAAPKKAGDDFLLLASEDDAKYVRDRMQVYYKSAKDSAAFRYYDNLISKIRSNLGKIIGFSYYSSGQDTAKQFIMPNPQQISIITDKGVASAAEAFILSARETSKKVVLYGANTHGMIDYMNINNLVLNCPGNKTYYFGYPTYFSKEIKTHPNNPTGIKPDIYIPANEKDWVRWVINAYNTKVK